MTNSYHGRLVMALFALMLTTPVWAQTSSSEISERIRSTLKPATPGISRPDDASRQSLRVEQMEKREGGMANEQRQERQENTEAEEMPQTCRLLQAEIDNKIKANKVVSYTVKVIPTTKAKEIVARNRDKPGKVKIVGHCSQGDYRVVYRRN